MKHVIDGQIVRLSAGNFDSHEIVINLAGGRGTFIVTSAQIGAFAVPVTAQVSLTIEVTATPPEPSAQPCVVVGRIGKVEIGHPERPTLEFRQNPVGSIGPILTNTIGFIVPLDVAKAFGACIGDHATITITPVG